MTPSRRFPIAVPLALLAFSLISATHAARAAEILGNNERIVFLGDSITQAGAGKGGYVTLVREALNKQKPDLAIEVFGAGISGNKVPDLQKRLDKDVLSKKPTLVVIYIGINDVWHWGGGKGTTKEDFDKGLRDVIGRIQAAGARVILCTPSVIGERTDGQNKFDEMLEEYSKISRTVAKDTKSPLLDLRQKFVDHLKANNKENKENKVLTSDGVHLNAAGNQFVAACVLESLGVSSVPGKLLRHVVLFKFKDDTSPEQVQKLVAAFGQLPKKIPQVQAFEWGTDNSPEKLAQGFTHCFTLTFKSAEDRDAYLPHPAHAEFVTLVKPHVDKVLVVDYWTQQ